MTRIVFAEFDHQRRFVEAARRAQESHYRVVEAYTPYPVEELSEIIAHHPSRVRPAMFTGGVLMAASAYGLEYYSAVFAYPFNSGGRPLDAWPAFMLVPFATGILLAAICGFAMFLREAGLPGLSNPVLASDGLGRASQDRFVLSVQYVQEDRDASAVAEFMHKAGATLVWEAGA
jgi:hypothetical protein